MIRGVHFRPGEKSTTYSRNIKTIINMATKFYLCPVCGNVVVKIEDSAVTPHCCGHEMVELQPGTADASAEKHVPVIEHIDDCTVTVKVGSQPHPMTPEHHICFIWLETVHGGQLKYLAKDDIIGREARAEFCTCKDHITAVYEYCNLHGLWKYDLGHDYKANEKCSK